MHNNRVIAPSIRLSKHDAFSFRNYAKSFSYMCHMLWRTSCGRPINAPGRFHSISLFSFNLAFFETSLFKEQGKPERVYSNYLLLKRRAKMDKRDQELLAKHLWSVSSPPQNSAIIGLTIIAVFLAGIAIGDILSKSKQTNTNYAAVFSRIAKAPP